MKKFSKTVGAMVLALGMAGSASAAYPEAQPVKVLVGYTPGGTTDLVARIVAKGLSDELKQSFVVENKPGAGGPLPAQALQGAPGVWALAADTEIPLEPEVAALHLRRALRAHAAGEEAPSQAVPVALPDGDGPEGGGLEDDVRQLIRMSEALAALRV